jgi:hypothetical protein
LPHCLQDFKAQFAFVKSLDDLKQPGLLKWRTGETSRYVSLSENEPYRALLHYLGKKLRVGEDRRICYHCQLYEVTATMTGRIDHLDTHTIVVILRPGAAMRTYSVGFGHMNAALTRLVLQSVSDVIATPIDPSVYEND